MYILFFITNSVNTINYTDVKTERWRIKAPSVIQRLPIATYQQMCSIITKNSSSNNILDSNSDETTDSLNLSMSIIPKLKKIKVLETKCSICRDDFEPNDDISLLPCKSADY